MTNLLLANLASPANPGDQAILFGTVKLLRSVFLGCKLTVATRAVSQKDAYWDLGCEVVPSYPNVEWLARGRFLRRLANVPRALADFRPLRDAVRGAECVFLAGGAYFYSYRPLVPGLTFLSHCSAAYWARRFKKKLIFLPQSYGPFASFWAEQAFAKCVRSGNLVFYREEISGNWLREQYPGHRQKFSFLPDLALYLSADDVLGPVPRQDPKTGIVGVTIRQWRSAGKDGEGYVAKLADALARFHADCRIRIRIIVQVQAHKKSEGDESVSRLLESLLIARIGREGVELRQQKPYFRLTDLCRLYEECEMLVSMRLHSGLLGFLLGRPALVVGYQHKTEGVLKSLGLEDLYAGSYDLIDSVDLSSRMKHVWSHRENGSRRIVENLARARRAIEIDFKRKMEGVFR